MISLKPTVLLPICMLAFAALNTLGDTAGVDRAIAGTKADIAAATAELNSLRDDIGAERVPLVRKIEELSKDVSRLRRAVENEREARRMRDDRLRELEAEVARLDDNFEFADTALLEYRRTLEAYAGAAEAPQLRQRMEQIDASLSGQGSGRKSLVDAARRLFELSADRTEHGFVGQRFQGACLDAGGRELQGVFAVAGPLQYFSSSAASGLVVMRTGSPRPALFSRLEQSELAAINRLAAAGAAVVPIDASGGNALKTRQSRKPLIEHLKDGGFTMYPLLAIGLISIALTIGKFASLSRATTADRAGTAKVVESLRGGDAAAARAAAEKIDAPLRQVVMEGIRHRSAARELIEEMMQERVMIIVPRLRRHLGTLAVFGAVAPLLGLLGTVTGMIHTFQLVTIFGTGDAKMLSGGISEALVTTETGLAIAIPVLLVHAYLSRRAGNITGELEHSVVQFVQALKSDEGKVANGDD